MIMHAEQKNGALIIMALGASNGIGPSPNTIPGSSLKQNKI